MQCDEVFYNVQEKSRAIYLASGSNGFVISHLCHRLVSKQWVATQRLHNRTVTSKPSSGCFLKYKMVQVLKLQGLCKNDYEEIVSLSRGSHRVARRGISNIYQAPVGPSGRG